MELWVADFTCLILEGLLIGDTRHYSNTTVTLQVDACILLLDHCLITGRLLLEVLILLNSHQAINNMSALLHLAAWWGP